jgi:hypothetical protein
MAFTIQRSATKTRAYIRGGPELVAKLQALDKKIRNEYAKAALTDGGTVIAEEWSRRAPVGTPPEDEHPGAYRDSLLLPDAIRVRASKNGATGRISPGTVSGIEMDDQPRVYAPKLEFRDSPPAARPAFDATKDEAVDVIGESLGRSIERFQ